ncbi:MAG: TetR family transcriptional regulator [Acidobacteria bacterium]|nr:TetR family transcriptional regulator [Acidobacteriota bacterium]
MKKKALYRKPLESSDSTAKKSEQTRSLILETALELFTEHGYEETTMRAIAEKAGVALGNTYYYFRSKGHLIQAFYDRLHELHRETCVPIMQREKTLKGRLRAVMRQILADMEPYHQFAGVLFRSAADPQSPLNPFSPDSEAVRMESIEWFAEVLKGTKTKIPPDLARELPTLLWLYHMGIVLFWIHDRSAKQVKTWRLMEQTVEIISRLISIASLPLMRPLRKSTLQMLATLREDVA